MKDKIINKLLSAKFLIALILTIVFSILAFKNELTTEFVTIYTMVVTFYFTKNTDK